MNIYKNFLPKDIYKELKNSMMSDHFPWYFNDGVNNLPDKYFQFTFVFIKNGQYQCWGQWQDVMIPVLKHIKHKKINRIKANLLTATDKIIEHEFHIDQEKGKTGILYLDNSNGYTKFKNGKKIKSEENKYVEFDSILEHTGSSCTDKKRRVVINFNYQ
jgi:hypothetical protein|tara:strand:- start:78 stop:554 length:477 start_codon:yes stop_codon:yes gene_type:complete